MTDKHYEYLGVMQLPNHSTSPYERGYVFLSLKKKDQELIFLDVLTEQIFASKS